MDKVPKKKTVSVNFTCTMFSLLDFLSLKMEPIRSPETLLRN